MTPAPRGLALAALLSLSFVPAQTSDDAPENNRYNGVVDSDETLRVGAKATGSGASEATGSVTQTASGPALRQVVVVSCASSIPEEDRHPGCYLVAPVYLGCPEGETESLTTLERTRTSAADQWTDWQLLDWVMCSPISPQTASVAMQVRAEWAQLQPGIPDLTIQPEQDWVYSTVPTIVYVDPAPVVVEETLLGTPVRIRATPTTFTWGWGDGEHTTTSDPGKPYPNETISHTYLYVDGDVDLTLQTTWAGAYSVNGGAWIDIDGTLTTTSDPVTLTVYSPHSQLVDCDLHGTCLDG